MTWGESPEFEVITDFECEVCEKKFTGSPKEAFDKGWDVPPYFTGYIKCEDCGSNCYLGSLELRLWKGRIMSAINDTPELDYQHLIIESGQSELLAKFYDWLIEQGYRFGQWVDEEFLAIHINPEKLFADFFGVDLNKIEQERRAILDELSKNYD